MATDATEIKAIRTSPARFGESLARDMAAGESEVWEVTDDYNPLSLCWSAAGELIRGRVHPRGTQAASIDQLLVAHALARRYRRIMVAAEQSPDPSARKKPTAKEATAKKAPPVKAPPVKATAKKATAKKATAKKATAKKATAKKATAKKPTRKTPAAKRPARKSPTAKSPAAKTPAPKKTSVKQPDATKVASPLRSRGDVPSPRRAFDVVVYGATGFVGRLVAEYLVDHAPVGVRIGLAGRSRERLLRLRSDLGAGAEDWGVLEAEATDVEALRRLAEATQVVATTVGPYAKYGLPLVAACANAGTDYVDLTGEVLFVRDCIESFDATAQASGARIVNSCGFDSIPSDLGVYLTFAAAAADNSDGLGETTLVVRDLSGGFSGGTVDSLRTQVDVTAAEPSLRAVLADPFALSPDRSAEPPTSDPVHRDRRGFHHSEKLGGWLAPFVMASYNTRIVRRTNALLDWAYGPDFRYSEVIDFGSGPTAPVFAAGMSLGLVGMEIGMRVRPIRDTLDRVLPKPGEGPSEDTMRRGHFRLEIVADAAGHGTYRTVVAAQGDPGYAATSVMLSESALCLALDRAELPSRAGVLTPATAMGHSLVHRLRAAGFTFETTRSD